MRTLIPDAVAIIFLYIMLNTLAKKIPAPHESGAGNSWSCVDVVLLHHHLATLMDVDATCGVVHLASLQGIVCIALGSSGLGVLDAGGMHIRAVVVIVASGLVVLRAVCLSQ